MFEKYTREYITYISKKNYSENTILSYGKTLEEFSQFLIRKNILWEQLNPQDVSTWLSTKKHLSPRTVALHLSTLKSFFEYLEKRNIINSNVFIVFSAPKSKNVIPTTLSTNEMLDLLQRMSTDTVLERRNKCMLILMYATGIRAEELCSLKSKDVSFWQDTIKVLGKGNKERMIPILPLVKHYIKNWLKDRVELDKEISDTLFLSKSGRRLTTSMIRKIVHKESIKNSKYIHPHAFRYTFASHLLENDANLRYIQELLGHANLSVTQRYTKVSVSRIKKKYKQFHPRA